MPLRSYTLLHRDARLSSEDRERILGWADAEAAANEGIPDDPSE